jgi:hypothetical protein
MRHSFVECDGRIIKDEMGVIYAGRVRKSRENENVTGLDAHLDVISGGN